MYVCIYVHMYTAQLQTNFFTVKTTIFPLTVVGIKINWWTCYAKLE